MLSAVVSAFVLFAVGSFVLAVFVIVAMTVSVTAVGNAGIEWLNSPRGEGAYRLRNQAAT